MLSPLVPLMVPAVRFGFPGLRVGMLNIPLDLPELPFFIFPGALMVLWMCGGLSRKDILPTQ